MPFDQFIIFFLFLLTGFLCKKYGVFTDSAVNGINTFVVNIAFPCLILERTLALDMNHSIFINFLLALFITLGVFVVFGFYARFVCRGKAYPDEDKPVSELAVFFPNNGFIGLPVAQLFYGGVGLLYMVGCNIALNTTCFTYGLTRLRRGTDTETVPFGKRVLKLLLFVIHPKICAAVLGIILCYNHISLPAFADGFLTTVGAVATPMAMISVGTLLAGTFGLRSFKKRVVMEPALNKILLIPVISAAIVWFLPIDPLVKTIIVVSNTMPIATMVPILSEQYGKNKGLAGETLVVSTIFSMATIPLFIWALKMLQTGGF